MILLGKGTLEKHSGRTRRELNAELARPICLQTVTRPGSESGMLDLFPDIETESRVSDPPYAHCAREKVWG
jgi:hypothetical protein